MYTNQEWLQGELASIREAGLWKHERVITGPQGPEIDTEDGRALNFCANNYLGLGDHEALIAAAREGLKNYGFGLSSVRFICGTQCIHKELESRIARFLGMDDSILYAACFDANGGLFEPLLGPDDAIISDELNHASIIDGIRLCKAQRFRYKHADLSDLERCLKESANARFRMIATDGAFSMHGTLAPLADICELADKYQALVMVDECHATGVLGETGRGTAEHFGVGDRVDIITSTLGKALGGASGGFTTARQEIVDILRQRSRPYLFSNSVAPPIVAASIRVLDILETEPERVARLQANTRRFRQAVTEAGFSIAEGVHPIVPIMIGDERKTMAMANELNARGIFVVGFSYPVVPKGQARIRVQISAAHTDEHIDRAVTTFTAVGREQGLVT